MQSVFMRHEAGRFTRAVALVTALALLCASGLASAAGAMCSARSPAHRVALVELYSSEGCNSCPPADAWLGQWKNGGAARSVVPLALHVDYWNSLGWTDRFSQHRFTERQESLTHLAGDHTIYSPEVFVAGRELRSWSRPENFNSRVAQLIGQPSDADVALDITPRAGGAFDVAARFDSRIADAAARLDAYVAVYENALSTQVGAGENRGATLHHERVVRQWFGPVPLVGGNAHIRRDIRLADASANTGTDFSADRFGVVAFVENAATGDVLQVADLAFCH
ncbi:DUF1223 domain-containing protein [Paraburkholderia phenoliruptrix]|uniref:DUF1223 domain-containing protein n=1 Tax=Paraburkholderia phenoliruptrix TaxID=252970 RepID=UPI003F6524B7